MARPLVLFDGFVNAIEVVVRNGQSDRCCVALDGL